MIVHTCTCLDALSFHDGVSDTTFYQSSPPSPQPLNYQSLPLFIPSLPCRPPEPHTVAPISSQKNSTLNPPKVRIPAYNLTPKTPLLCHNQRIHHPKILRLLSHLAPYGCCIQPVSSSNTMDI